MTLCTMRRRPHTGFSLVEVVIALGIVSFAVLAIVGMMPMALKSAQDSMRETDATLVAQRIFAELKTGIGANRTVTKDTNNNSQTISLSANTITNFLAFTQDGMVQEFANSAPANASYDFYAQISVFTNTGIANLSRVQIDIAAPAAAPATARTTNSFTTLLGF
jgi:uncharacterized protein (TIGR02598 family)